MVHFEEMMARPCSQKILPYRGEDKLEGLNRRRERMKESRMISKDE